MNMQEKTHNFFQILGFSIRKGRFSCSFLLKEKNQKFKAAPASLLSPFIPLESRKLALRAQTAELPVAPFRSLA